MQMNQSVIDSSHPEQSGKRLKYIRTHLLNVTRRELCEHTDISVAAVKAWELGLGGGLTEKGAEKLIPRLRELGIYCSVAWLLHGIGTEAAIHTATLQTNPDEDAQIAKELLAFRAQGNTLDAVIIDDGMLPLLPPATVIGGVLQRNTHECLGKICIVRTAENIVLVRIVEQGDMADTFHLTCSNPQPHLTKKIMPNMRLKDIAPVVWIRRKS